MLRMRQWPFAQRRHKNCQPVGRIIPLARRSMAGRSLRTFAVLPHLPERLQALQKLAYNMWWCWNHEAVSLLRRIDDDLFDAVENSPVKMLGAIDQSRLE